MSDFALSPWQMWGTSAIVQSNQRGAVSQQLAKVSYKRPETWAFFLAARIVQLVNTTDLNPVSIAVQWNVISGVGRSFFQTPNLLGGLGFNIPALVQPFAFMCWREIPPNTDVEAIPNNPRFTTESRTNPLDDADETSVFPLKWIVSEDIQCSAIVTQSSNIIVDCSVELTSFFAPLHHVRPEWFADEEAQRFRGHEHEGT